MITTSVLLAIASVSALVVLDVIEVDFGQIAQQRRTMASREAAEGGLMEMLNDQDVLVGLPTYQTTKLRTDVTPSSSSVFGKKHLVRGPREYRGRFELVRDVPMLESSHSVVRAVVFDVRVDAQAANGASSRIEAEVFRIAASKPGTIRPRMHAR